MESILALITIVAAALSLILTIFILIAVGKLFSIERSLRQLATPEAGGLLSMVNQIAVNTSPSLLPVLITIESNTRPKH
jgi:hypothetical protein